MMMLQVPAEISNRHVHLTQEHVEALFGPEYKLKPMKALSQPGHYAAEETVTLVGPKGSMVGVRVLGPTRENSQVELATTDTYKLGVRPPLRDSGDLDGTPGIELVGPYGRIQLQCGVIVAARHIHMSSADAFKYAFKDGTHVKIEIPGPRGGIFNNVLIRISNEANLTMHIDTDEGNAFNITNGELVTVITDEFSLAAR